MTSKERVRRAVKFQGPDRVPVDLPEPYGSDFLHVGPDPHPDWRPSVRTPERWEDEWGCIWEKLPGDKTMGQVKFHPLTLRGKAVLLVSRGHPAHHGSRHPRGGGPVRTEAHRCLRQVPWRVHSEMVPLPRGRGTFLG